MHLPASHHHPPPRLAAMAQKECQSVIDCWSKRYRKWSRTCPAHARCFSPMQTYSASLPWLLLQMRASGRTENSNLLQSCPKNIIWLWVHFDCYIYIVQYYYIYIYFWLISILAAKSKMCHQVVASQHLGDWRHLSVAPAAKLHRRSGLGANAPSQGCYLGP